MDWRKSEHVFGPGRGGRAKPAADPARGRAAGAADAGETPGARSGRRPPHEVRVDEIIAVATRLIARDGYHRASMRRIAQATGVSLAGLYHYFPSKERLLFLIQYRAFSGLLNEVTAALNGVNDPVEQLRLLVHTHVQYVVGNMAALKVCSHELDSLNGAAYDELRRVRRRYYDLARSIVVRVLEEGGGSNARAEKGAEPKSASSQKADPGTQHSPLDARIATMSLFGMLNWLYRWYDPGPRGRDRAPAGLAGQIFSQFLAGLTDGGRSSHAGRPKVGGRGAASQSRTRSRTSC